MKTITIELPDEVAHFYEVRAAMDDKRLPEALPLFLQAAMWKFQGEELETTQ